MPSGDDEHAYRHTVRVPVAFDAFGNPTVYLDAEPEAAGMWDSEFCRDNP